MTKEPFQDVPVWRAVTDLNSKVSSLCHNPVFQRGGDVAGHLQRAAISIPDDLSAGFARGHTRELIASIEEARSSMAEIRSICGVLQESPSFRAFETEILSVKTDAKAISRKLKHWTNSLESPDAQNSRGAAERGRDVTDGKTGRDEPRRKKRRNQSDA